MRDITSPSLVRQMVLDAFFVNILIVLGMIKIPSIFPGAGFQLSAPYAVWLARKVGFKRYILIGCCASLIQFLLGTHNVWNIIVSMVFRVVAGGLASQTRYFQRASLLLAGPCGSFVARVVLAVVLGVPFLPLLIVALPGMVFTVICVAIMEAVLDRVFHKFKLEV